MIASLSDVGSSPELLVSRPFGPQALLTFDVGFFNKLQIQMRETVRYRCNISTARNCWKN